MLKVSPNSKTQLARQCPLEPLVLRSLGDSVGHDKDEMTLCPVRCLKAYLQRTKATRALNASELLFLAYKTHCKKEISSSTVSQWLKDLIIYTHETATAENIRLGSCKAHDIRSVVTSQLYYRESINKVMEVGKWLSHNSFTSFYLKDVTF